MKTADLLKLYQVVDMRSRIPVLRCFCFTDGKVMATNFQQFIVAEGDRQLRAALTQGR